MDPNGGRFTYQAVSVGGAPAVEVCLDEEHPNPVAAWVRDHGWIDEPVQRAFVDLVRPGMRVLDLGCHIGLFSLTAARLGASVVALDANPRHVEWVRAAARRNGFADLTVVHAAAAASAGEVGFVERDLYGRIERGADDPDVTVVVRSTTVDEVLAAVGWGAPDVVKMDIEGAEELALDGMRGTFSGGARPVFVFEVNATTLPGFGSSTHRLRERFAELGYELLLIDHLRPGILVAASPQTLQSEAVCDYLALPPSVAPPAGRWVVEPPLSIDHVVTRVLDAAAGEDEGYRSQAALLVAEGPAWLRGHPAVRQARRGLELDETEIVRAAFDARVEPGMRDELDVEPPPGGPIGGLSLFCEGLAVDGPDDEPERTPDIPVPPGVVAVLRDLWLHARPGDVVALVAGDPVSASAALDAIEGRTRPAAGTVVVAGRVVRPLRADALEPELTVATNLAILAAMHGANVPDVARRAEELCGWCELAGLEDEHLADVPLGSAQRIGLAAGLMAVEPRVVLLDVIDAEVLGPAMADRIRARLEQLCAAGATVVEVVRPGDEPIARPVRALWLDEGEVAALGHPRSVLAAAACVDALIGVPA